MASKKATETDAGATCVKKRYMSADQCKQAATRISAEMRDYPKHLNQWQRRTGPPVVPLWGPDFEAVEAKINRLYHPEEAALIIEALTP